MLKSILAVALLVLPINSAASLKANAQEGAAVYEEMFLGNEHSAVAVVEYASFTCPHCGTFHNQVFGKLKAEYIDTGKIKFELREVYFDRPGLWAGILARCGGPGKYFGIVDLLFKRQAQWSRRETAMDIAAELLKIGIVAGIERTEIEACFQDQANAEMLYDAYLKFAEEDGITSTPSFVIEGEKYGYMDFDEFSRTLDDLLAN